MSTSTNHHLVAQSELIGVIPERLAQAYAVPLNLATQEVPLDVGTFDEYLLHPARTHTQGRRCCLQNQLILRRRSPHGGKWNAVIESNEPSFVLNRESKQVYVGQLPRSMDSRRIRDIRIQ
jgi:hypothetical protein